MNNARHAALTDLMKQSLLEREGHMLLYKPAHFTYEQAVQELRQIFGEGQTTVLSTIPQSSIETLTIHQHGQRLMQEHYEFSLFPDHTLVMETIHRHKGIGVHPDHLLRLWAESSTVTRKAQNEYRISDAQKQEVEKLLEVMNKDIENAFTSQSRISMTGFLHLASVLTLQGQPNLISIQSSGSAPPTPRARHLMSKSARRVIFLTSQPTITNWHIQFPNQEQ